jgi:hypothetical protein
MAGDFTGSAELADRSIRSISPGRIAFGKFAGPVLRSRIDGNSFVSN